MTDMGSLFQKDSQGLLLSLDMKDEEFLKTIEVDDVSTFYALIKKKQIDFFPPGTSLWWLFEGKGHEVGLPTLL